MDIEKSMSIPNLVTFIYLKKIRWDPCSARTKGKPLPRKSAIAFLMQILNYERSHLLAIEILLHISWSKISD